MKAIRQCLLAIAGTCALWLAAAPAVAQVGDFDARLPMDIDADNTAIDGKNDVIIFSGLRLTQGRVSIQADEGRARRMELEDSTWRFSGNVVIDVATGRIECDSAELLFDDFRLKQAVVTGSPATYTLQRPGTEEVTHAEAGRLAYDVDQGIIEFSEQATITEGGNQISSNVFVYNITEQRINADSNGDDGRVRITYTPANGIELPGDDTDESDDETDESGDDTDRSENDTP